MIIAFLDILGFTQLVEHNYQTALDNLYEFNRYIDTARNDSKLYPAESYKDPELQEFVNKHYVTSFENILTMSDSLVIATNNTTDFIKQLSSMLCHLFMATTKNFSKPFDNIYNVDSSKNVQSYIVEENGEREYRFEYHKTFPLLFRGGITVEKDHKLPDGTQVKGIAFFEQSQVIDGKNVTGWNVCGPEYVDAVKLENCGKGPRLFCDKFFYDKIEENERKYLRKVDENTYEILWTYECCTCGSQSSEIQSNVYTGIHYFLEPSIRLYKYYKRYQNEDIKGNSSIEELFKHYKQLVILVCRGIYKYAVENGISHEKIKEQLEAKIADLHIFWEL